MYWHPNDLRQLAALIEAGQFVPSAPAAEGLYSRGVDATQYSSGAIAVPMTAEGPGNDTEFTHVLKLNASSGAPRTWHVRAAMAVETPSPLYYAQGMTVRVRWSTGANVDVADIDFRSGVVCFPITCESIEVLARIAPPAASRPLGGVTAKVQAALSAYPLAANWRAPTLTVSPLVTLGNMFVNVPRHAQQVTVICDSSVSAPTVLRFMPTVGASLGEVSFSGHLRELDIPAGTARIDVTTIPPPGTTMAFVFRLGL